MVGSRGPPHPPSAFFDPANRKRLEGLGTSSQLTQLLVSVSDLTNSLHALQSLAEQPHPEPKYTMAKDGVHNRDDFLRYIRYFNESKDEEKHTFYGDNVSLALPLTALLEGNAAIAKHYNFIHEMAEERLDVVELLFDKEQDPTRILSVSSAVGLQVKLIRAAMFPSV